MRERIQDAVKEAMKSGNKTRLATLRLISAAIKDRDIAAELGGKSHGPVDEAGIVAVLQSMVKQRRESFAIFRDNGRADLADKEASEIAVIEEFLPKQMSEPETKAAIGAAVKQLGATSPKDMGRVMAALKERYAGRMDMGRASALAKEHLK